MSDLQPGDVVIHDDGHVATLQWDGPHKLAICFALTAAGYVHRGQLPDGWRRVDVAELLSIVGDLAAHDPRAANQPGTCRFCRHEYHPHAESCLWRRAREAVT